MAKMGVSNPNMVSYELSYLKFESIFGFNFLINRNYKFYIDIVKEKMKIFGVGLFIIKYIKCIT